MKNNQIFPVTIILSSIVLLGLSLLVLTMPNTGMRTGEPSPTDRIAQAWESVADSDAYQFDTHIRQTVYPRPALGNVGRQPQTEEYYLAGQRDQAKDLVEMTLWQNARGSQQSGLSVRTQAGRTYVLNRTGEWEERDGFGDLAAPGGDPLVFLQTTENITPLGMDERQVGGLTFVYDRFGFDIDTTAYAGILRAQLDAQLDQYGSLPAGMTLKTPEIYRQISGQGQVWLDDAGMPRRLEVQLSIPPQANQGRVDAKIVTDLFGFTQADPRGIQGLLGGSPRAGLVMALAEGVAAARSITSALLLILGTGLLLFGMIRHRASARVYAVTVVLVTLSMVLTPLLQSVQAAGFMDRVQSTQAAQAERHAEAQASVDAQKELYTADWHPHQDPLAAPNTSQPAAPVISASNTVTDTTDSDGDGLLDVDEAHWGTRPYLGAPEGCTGVTDATDSDGDGLGDGVEVQEVGTHPDVADTDSDGISDADEISGFSYGGQTWYLNPLENDTNYDGLIDGVECRVRTQGIPAEYNAAGVCPDTDGDDQPDVFDEDNDNDGVPDRDDISPFSASSGFFGENNPLKLNVSNLALDKPVFVDFQFRPQTASNLNLYNHVLDWPSQDGAGQIQRVLDTTWADTSNLNLRSNAANAANGDIRLVPMLEITMPYADGHYANLPITTTAPAQRVLGVSVDEWVDEEQLAPHGIEVSDLDVDAGTMTALIPLVQVKDRYGTPQAFRARMFYNPSQGTDGRADWGADQEVRMVWLVQMITDQCPAGYDDVREEASGQIDYKCVDPDTNVEVSREEVLTIGHVYPDTWRLTGMVISEEHDFDMAILYEDPAQDSDLTADDQLMVASWNLSNGFMIGRDCDTKDGNGDCVGDGSRDVTVENLATNVASWFTDSYYVNIETFLNYDHGAYLAYIIGTEVQPLLDTHFGGHPDATPTLMYVQDHTNRELNLDNLTQNSAAGLITFDGDTLTADLIPAEVPVQVKSSMSWTPYQYVNGAWQAAEVEAYLTQLDTRLQQDTYFQPADASEATTQEAADRRLWVQTYYATLWSGLEGWTELAGQPLYLRSADPDLPDVDYDPFLTPGTEYGATILALKAIDILQAGSFSSFSSSVGTAGARGYTVLVLVTWSALALMAAGDATGNQSLRRTGEIILASVSLLISTMYLVSFVYSGGLIGSLQYQGAGLMGVFFIGGVTWGIFLLSVINGNMSTVAISVAASVAIAVTLMTVILFILTTVGLGLISFVLGLIDSIFLLMNMKGPSQYAIEYMADVLYDVDSSLKNLDSGDRLAFQVRNVELRDPFAGFQVNNAVTITMGITNTVKYNTKISGEELSSASIAAHNTFTYALQTAQIPHHEGLAFVDDWFGDQWTPRAGNRFETSTEDSVSIPFSSVGIGINRGLKAYLTESFRTGYRTCWNYVIDKSCRWRDFSTSIHIPMDDSLVYDILPVTIEQFAGMDWSRNSTPPLPRQVDRDGDGLDDWSGTDPSYERFDTDQDGLGDAYELAHGYNPTAPDSDFDGINDKPELIIGTNPLLRDTDGDGLSDGTEAVDGWLYVYGNGQLARTWSDPFTVDTDGDGLGDMDELIFGFNPWVATDPSLITQLVQFDNLGVREKGAPELLLSFEDNPASTAFFDGSGEGHHATCTGDGCPQMTDDGRYGQAVTFDGNDYLRVPFVLNPGETPFTVATWVKVSDTSNQPVLFQQLDGNGTGRTWLSLNSNGTLGTYLGGSNLNGSSAVPLGTWQHVAVSFDGATLRLYLNGTLEAESERSMEASQGSLWLGQHKSGGRFLDGAMDDVVILGQGLDAGGIADLMNGRLNPNDNLLASGTDLTYQATITNTSAVSATGFLVADNAYVSPEVGHPMAAFGFQQSERLVYFANQGERVNKSIICVDNGTCPAFNMDGKYDQGLGFYSPQSDYALIPSLGRQERDTPLFNLSFWMRVDQFPPAGEIAMILDTESEESGALDVYIDSSGKLYWSLVGDPDSPRVSTTALVQYQQTHISIDNLRDLYINGSLDVSGSYPYGSLERLMVGPGTLGNSVDFGKPYFGAIDELVYFSNGQPNYITDIRDGIYNNAEMVYTFSAATISQGYDNRANDLRSLTCPSLGECPSHTGGKYGRGIALDGVDDYMEWDNVINPAITPLTAAVWFKADGFGNEPNLLQQKDDNGTGRTWLGIRRGGPIYTYLGGSYLNGSTAVQPGVWNHAAVTYDGTTLRLYLNGMEEASSVRALEANDSNVLVGRSKPTLVPNFFDGDLDELFIIPQALSEEAVQAVMNSSWPMIDVVDSFVPYSAAAVSNLTVSGDAPVSAHAVTSQHRFDQEVEAALELQADVLYPLVDPYASDLVFFIPFEDGPGSTIAENYIEYPNSRGVDPDMDANCLSQDACPTLGLRGQVDRAAYFDGRDDFFYVPSVPGTEGIYPVHTIASWVNAEAGTILELLRFGSSWTLTMDGFDMSGNSFTSDPKFIAFDLPRKEWFHLVVTVDNDRIVHIYVNGVEVASGSGTLPTFRNPSGGGIEVYLGGNNRGQNYLEGYLDDLRIYSVSFDAADAANLYAISAPLMRFEFDEDEGATQFRDNSVGQYVGSPSQASATVDGETVTVPSPSPGTKGRIGNGALFDGEGVIEVADATATQALTNDFTFMAWVRPESVSSGVQGLFGAGFQASINGYDIVLDNGALRLRTFGVKSYDSSVTLQPDVWQHVAVVLDSNNDAHFYLNGVLQQTIPGSSPARQNSDDPLYIGGQNSSLAFTGMIDELAIYGRSLLEAELYGIYLRELRWYRNKAVTYLTIDTDNPTIGLLSDAAYWPNGYIQLAVATTDPTSAVRLLDVGLKAHGASSFTWQGAPACAESGSRGGVWCPSFDSSQLGGEGAYELQFRAVDAVGNETTSQIYTLYVDATPPTATGQAEYDGRLTDLTESGDLQWTLALSGGLNDPTLAGTTVAGSGVVTDTVLVSLIDQAGGLVSEQPQAAMVSGGTWSVNYVLDGNRPQGTYTLFVSLEDEVGNQRTVSVGSLRFDERPPSVDLDNWRLPATQIISQTQVLSGTVSELPSWGDNMVVHHFEEEPGASIFYNAATSQYITPTHSTCAACPTAGEAGLFGKAVEFDGVNDAIALSHTLDPSTQSFSAAVWFQAAALPGTHTILQQLDGSGTGRNWLFISGTTRVLYTFLGGSVLTGQTQIVPGQWYHAAVTYDGTTVRLYLDGQLEAAATRTAEANDGDLVLGVDKNNTNRFAGLLDEFALHDRALDAAEIYALAQLLSAGAAAVEINIVPQDFTSGARSRLAASSWVSATLESANAGLTTWHYTLPNDLEGYYNIHLRGSDAFGNLSGESVAWRGLIDVVSPTVTVTAQHTWQGVSPLTDYRFTFSDFILDESSYVQPCTTGDLTSQPYNDTALPHDGLPYAVSGSCQVAGHEASRTFTACDVVGHCTTETVTPAAVTQFPLAVGVSGTGSGQISSTPAGIACTADCSALFAVGATVTLTATADIGSTFDGWSGACSGTGDCVVTLDDVKNVLATFTPTRPALTVPLYAGWNLFGLPDETGQTITTALSSIAGDYTLVYGRNAQGGWDFFSPAAPGASPLVRTTLGSGYWVNVSQDTTLATTVAVTTSPSIELSDGWNLVGYPLMVGQTATDTFHSLAGQIRLAYGWDAQAHTWRIYYPSAPSLSDLTDLVPGGGYWVAVSGDATWSVNQGSRQSTSTAGADRAWRTWVPQSADGANLLPPSTLYGIAGTEEVGVTVEAWVGDALCGTGTTQRLPRDGTELGGQVVYLVHVTGDGDGAQAGCGQEVSPIRLVVDGEAAPVTALWRSGVQRVDLGEPVSPPYGPIFLPILLR